MQIEAGKEFYFFFQLNQNILMAQNVTQKY